MSQDEKRDWSGYKLATFLVSVLSVIVIGAQALYNNYYVQRWKKIEYLTAELVRKRQELEHQALTPKVALNLNTLEKAGLSSQLLDSLSAVPSTVEITNVGGGTAKGLLVDLTSTEQIIQFQKWPSPESFFVTRRGADAKALRLESAQIRKGSVIGLTLLTKKLPKLDTKVLLDSGELVSPQEEQKSKDLSTLLLKLPFELFVRLSTEERARLQNETDPLKVDVMILEKRIESLQSESVWDYTFDWSLVLPLILAGPLVLSTVWIIQLLRADRRKRSGRNKTVQRIRSNVFQPRTLTAALRDLGTPDESKVFGEGNAEDLELVYFSKYELRPSTNGLRLRFRDHKLLRVDDENGYPILLVSNT